MEQTVDSVSSTFSKAELMQNRFNLFADQAIIPYFVPQAIKTARLDIFTPSGQRIKSLELPNTGAGQVTLEIGAVPTGMHAYTLALDSKIVATEQMIITH